MSILSMPATSVLIEGGTTPNTPFGYCHELQLVANVDGTISPSSFIFGNKGDINVTSLDIDISALEALYGDILSKYSLVLSIYNPNEEYSAFNPYNYTLYTNHFPIPENITKKSTQTPYRCLLKLTEKVPSDGHIDEQEIWISKEFTATVNDTLWNDQIQQIIINATAPSLNISNSLIKNTILVAPTSDHYGITSDKTTLGDKRDAFITKIEFWDTAKNTGLSKKYGIFEIEDLIFCAQLEEFTDTSPIPKYYCFVPQELTAMANTVAFTIIETSERVVENLEVADSGYKQIVGSTLAFSVADNFLEDRADLFTDFFTQDNGFFRTASGLIFTTKNYENS